MNLNSFMRVPVQKKYFFEFKFEYGKMIEFFRVRVSSPDADMFFYSSPIFSEKIVDLRTCRPLFLLFLLINALWGQFEPTFSKKGQLCKKV